MKSANKQRKKWPKKRDIQEQKRGINAKAHIMTSANTERNKRPQKVLDLQAYKERNGPQIELRLYNKYTKKQRKKRSAKSTKDK